MIRFKGIEIAEICLINRAFFILEVLLIDNCGLEMAIFKIRFYSSPLWKAQVLLEAAKGSDGLPKYLWMEKQGIWFRGNSCPCSRRDWIIGGIRFLPYPQRNKICYPQSLEPCSIGDKDVSYECRRPLAYPKCLLSYWKSTWSCPVLLFIALQIRRT